MPTEDELQSARVYSEQADNRGHYLEKRFGHPSLHADLFTPMLHASMMPLLKEVYKGKIDDTSVNLQHIGGEKRAAQVVPSGIVFAGVEQVCRSL
jgi:calcium permeable stress-gated cation channel